MIPQVSLRYRQGALHRLVVLSDAGVAEQRSAARYHAPPDVIHALSTRASASSMSTREDYGDDPYPWRDYLCVPAARQQWWAADFDPPLVAHESSYGAYLGEIDAKVKVHRNGRPAVALARYHDRSTPWNTSSVTIASSAAGSHPAGSDRGRSTRVR
jgi:hypothetical protein